LATTRSSRARFALPDHGKDDQRVDQAIESFLEGPTVRRNRPALRRKARKGYPNTGSRRPAAATAVVAAPEPDARRLAVPRPVADIRTLPGRLEFGAALERESLRAARYGRPARWRSWS